jgi:hypothetical protein
VVGKLWDLKGVIQYYIFDLLDHRWRWSEVYITCGVGEIGCE